MPDWLIPALASAALTAVPTFVLGWWTGRSRWHPEQSKIVVRLLTASDEFFDAIGNGDDGKAELERYREADAEADVLLPARLRRLAEMLDVELRQVRLMIRVTKLGATPPQPTAGAELHSAIQNAKGTRSRLRTEAKKHFGIPDGT